MNITKFLPKILLQTGVIVLTSAVFGLIANEVNPKGVQISSFRPKVEYATDDVLAQDLGEVSLGNETVTLSVEEMSDGPIVISTEQLKKLIAKDRAVLVDARLPLEFEHGHIPESINIPFENFGEYSEQIEKLPQNKWIVCFCDGPPCDLGELLAFELFTLNIPKIAIYQDGINDWIEQGGELQQ